MQGTRYLPGAEITRENVGRLQVAWTYRTGEAEPRFATKKPAAFEATPLVVDDTMYIGTPLGRVIALDPATGRERWVFDPRIARDVTYGDFATRGVSTWLDDAAADGAPCRRRIFVATAQSQLIALDARDGAPCSGFGVGGIVDLKAGLRIPPFERQAYTMTSPPVVVNGVVVTGSSIGDNSRPDTASGEVRGFDARTGQLRWTWDPIPQDKDDPAYGEWRGVAGAQERRRQRVVVTRRRSRARPRLRADGQRRSGLLRRAAPRGQPLRQLDRRAARVDGQAGLGLPDRAPRPVGLRQRLAAGAGVRSRATASTYRPSFRQRRPACSSCSSAKPAGRSFRSRSEPFPRATSPGRKPPARSPSPRSLRRSARIDSRADEAWGLTDSDRTACRTAIEPLRNEGIFTPPSTRGTLVLPSNIGGAHWGGVAIDPVRQLAIVPVNRIAAMVQLIARDGFDLKRVRAQEHRMGSEYQYNMMLGTPYVMRRRMLIAPSGVPCTPPPFGTLVAIDLKNGARAWEVPLGSAGALFNPEVAKQAQTSWGSPNLGGPITAGGLVFIGASLDRRLHAYDIGDGRELWSGPLPESAKATPDELPSRIRAAVRRRHGRRRWTMGHRRSRRRVHACPLIGPPGRVGAAKRELAVRLASGFLVGIVVSRSFEPCQSLVRILL